MVSTALTSRPYASSIATKCFRIHRPSRLATRCSAQAGTQLQQQQDTLLAAVQSLGYPASIFPGDEHARADIDSCIMQLEKSNPTSPLLQLLGNWQLVYASRGTYVTRTLAAKALLAASRLPGIGVADVRQALRLPSSSTSPSSSSSPDPAAAGPASLRTSNLACFGLGPMGEWEVCIEGVWKIRDGSLARVSFDSFTLQLVGMLGLKLPRMAKITVPIPNSRQVDFSTTYVSEDVRIARGSTGNVFVFRKVAP